MTEDKSNLKEKTRSKIVESIKAVILAVLIALFIRTFVLGNYEIPSGSMKPTLLVGDRIFVNKFFYGVKLPYFRKTIIPFHDPQRGDVVVFIYPKDRSKDFIKRVIGVAGDTIEIKNKQIFINGKLYSDSYGIYSDSLIYPKTANVRDNFDLVTVPEGSLFMMGDNRDESLDSRFWGFVDLKDVEGKAFVIYWSWDSVQHALRWKHLGSALH